MSFINNNIAGLSAFFSSFYIKYFPHFCWSLLFLFSFMYSSQSHIVCLGEFLQLSVYDHRIIRAMSIGGFFLIFPLRFHFIRNPFWVICLQWAIFSSRSYFMLLREALHDIYSYLKGFDLHLHLYIFFLCNMLPCLVSWTILLFL